MARARAAWARESLAIRGDRVAIPPKQLARLAGQYGVLEGTTQLYSNTGRTVLVEPVTGSIVIPMRRP